MSFWTFDFPRSFLDLHIIILEIIMKLVLCQPNAKSFTESTEDMVFDLKEFFQDSFQTVFKNRSHFAKALMKRFMMIDDSKKV